MFGSAIRQTSLAVVIGLVVLATVLGQDSGTGSGAYLSNITVAWSAPISQIDVGNGAFLSPQGNLLVVVCKDATVYAFNPKTGVELWKYTPASTDTLSLGGAHFSKYNGQSYVLFSAVTNAQFADLAKSTMIALDAGTGAVLFQTAEMTGIAMGTPVTTKDGSHLMTTHNVEHAVGYFSIFNYGKPEVNLTFTAEVSSTSGNASTLPFGAIGYIYDPIEGSYPEGSGNPNDLFMWTADTPGSATVGGDGQMYAFQIPVLNPFNSTPLEVALVGNETSFQSPNPPVFAGQGFIMYQAVTKAEIRYWAATGIPRDYFKANSAATVGFDRGLPRFKAAGAPPTLSSDPLIPFVYGPGPAEELYRMPYDLSSNIVYNTTSPLTNRVLISPDDLYVYYANKDGILAQLDATTLNLVWNITVGGSVNGEMAQSLDGVYIYVADSAGMLKAFQVKEPSTAVSIPPSVSPSFFTVGVVSSDSPTPGAVIVDTMMPSDASTDEGSMEGTEAPVAVSAPSEDVPTAPVAAPVVPPTADMPSSATLSSTTTVIGSLISIVVMMYCF